MNSNPQNISDYIYFYPDVMDKKTCTDIIKHFSVEADWKTSTFSTKYENIGTHKVSMQEYSIGKPLKYYKEINVGTNVNENIKATCENGLLKITILKNDLNIDSNIEIN